MEVSAFFAAIDSHPHLQGIGLVEDEGEAKAVVRDTRNDFLTSVSADAIAATDWTLLEEVLTGNREPVALSHMSRVCGYYSRVENWNPSKVNELQARRRGQYSLAGVEA